MARLAVATAIAALAMVSSTSAGTSEETIEATDSRINYIGRFMDDADNTKTMAWTATQIAIKFEGASVSIMGYHTSVAD